MNIQGTDHTATDLSICMKENFSNFPWFVFGCVLEQGKEELDEINKGRWEKARNAGVVSRVSESKRVELRLWAFQPNGKTSLVRQIN